MELCTAARNFSDSLSAAAWYELSLGRFPGFLHIHPVAAEIWRYNNTEAGTLDFSGVPAFLAGYEKSPLIHWWARAVHAWTSGWNLEELE